MQDLWTLEAALVAAGVAMQPTMAEIKGQFAEPSKFLSKLSSIVYENITPLQTELIYKRVTAVDRSAPMIPVLQGILNFLLPLFTFASSCERYND
jgi:hypothetical protein